MFSYWSKVSEGKSSKLSTIMYQLLHKMLLNGEYESKWLLKIKSVIDNCGMSFIWMNQEDIQEKNKYKRVINIKINDITQQEWIADIASHRNCQNYKIIKCELSCENYYY